MNDKENIGILRRIFKRNSQSKYLSSGTDASKESDAKDSRRREVLCIKEGNLPNKQREQLNKLIDERKFIERDVAYAKELQRKVNIEYKEYQLKMERQARKDSLRARQLQREEKDEYEKILQILADMAKKDEEFAKELQMKEVVEAENAEEAERMHTTNHNA